MMTLPLSRTGPSRRANLAAAANVLLRATMGLLLLGATGFGQPAVLSRRSGRVIRR